MPPSKIVGPIIGGVVGAGAIAGVIAVSVLQAQKKGILPKQAAAPSARQVANQVIGGMTLQVPNGGTFMGDAAAQSAVAQGIADAAGVDPKYVHVKQIRSANPRRARRLADIVKMTYSIDLPPTSAADTVTSALKAKPLTQLTTHVQNRLNVAKGPGFNVAVTQHDAQPVAPQPPVVTANEALPPIASKAVASGAIVPTPAPGPATTFLASSGAQGSTLPATTGALATTMPSVSSGSTEGQAIALACGLVACACLAICLVAMASFVFGRKKRGAPRRQTVAPEDFREYPDQQPLMEKQRQGTMVQTPASAPDMYSQYAAQPATNINVGAGGNIFLQASVPIVQDVVPMQTMPPPPMFAQPAALASPASPLAATLQTTGYLGQSLPATSLSPELPPTIYG